MAMKDLTPRLEDVMMALWEMEQNQKVVRVKDLERYFDIRTSSAIDFIRALKKRNLLHHEKYGYIELTAEGNTQARRINAKRTLLNLFFTQVLLLDPAVAEKEACSFEHHIHRDTQKAMERLIAFFGSQEHTGSKISSLFRFFCEQDDGRERAERIFPLSEIHTPGYCLVERISGETRKKAILEEMGLRPGTHARVCSSSPLGDPLCLQVKGAPQDIFLSLKDASLVLVRQVQEEP